eukprot:8187298-Pyramimonas_sp.AAC.1
MPVMGGRQVTTMPMRQETASAQSVPGVALWEHQRPEVTSSWPGHAKSVPGACNPGSPKSPKWLTCCSWRDSSVPRT